jgi:rhamnulokinase
VVGGGSKNPLLNQFIANALGIPVMTGPAEASALGNLLIQAIALGHLPSLATAREVVRNSTAIESVEPQELAPWRAAFDRLEQLLIPTPPAR